jgi:8-oxo-dGTP pyrophosphatase MutT (NUDIX family)
LLFSLAPQRSFSYDTDMIEEAEFYASLPKKRMGAAAFFLNQEEQILLVKPTYRDYWLLPGGSIEADESPLQGCMREVREELGLDLIMERLLCLDYVARQGVLTENVQFIFAGGTLSRAQIEAIKLPAKELSDFQFCPLADAITLVSPRMSKRLVYCFKALREQTTIYLEGGRQI